MTVGQVIRLALTQTGLLGLVAGVLSWPAGLTLALILIYVINRRSFGWTIQTHIDPMIFARALVLAVSAALLAGLAPPGASSACRSPPACARSEDDAGPDDASCRGRSLRRDDLCPGRDRLPPQRPSTGQRRHRRHDVRPDRGLRPRHRPPARSASRTTRAPTRSTRRSGGTTPATCSRGRANQVHPRSQ
ncbi:MAG: hypothetical protein IPG72_14900 [Ardenticatenales bacterium]|nr:hypothetical protein [Ardenticatenales bacterium]